MATNKEIKDAEQIWDRMDDTGYAGKLGSNKPKATQMVQAAYQKLRRGQHPVEEPLQDTQPPLMPMTESEQREAAIKATEDRLQPNGRYRRSRRPFVRSHPSDYSAGMREINQEGLRRARSKQ